MKFPSVPLTLTTFAFLFLTELFAQCGNPGNNLQNYSVLTSQETVSSSIIDEISGLTYNDQTNEFYVVSDDGKLARRKSNGNWQAIDVNDWSGNNCSSSRFGDIEGITYMGSVNNNSHRYAIAEERKRHITFVEISTTQSSLNYPNNSYLKFSGISYTPPSCGANDGIESVAYDQNTNKMYFAKERNNQIIYSFTVPSSIYGQTITPAIVINLANISNLDTYAIHGMDILSNGNIMALVAKSGPSWMDSGLYERMILEFDSCGNLISRVDVEPTINDSAELEGIAFVNNSICLIGEFGVMYHLDTPPTASVFPDLEIQQIGNLTQNGNIITNSNVSIANIGSDHAGNYSVGAYLSTDQNIDFTDLRLGTAKTYSSHVMNNQQFFTYTSDLSTYNLNPGTYYLGYIVDEYDDQNESDETNNIAAVPQQIIINANCPTAMNINYTPVPSGIYETSVSIHSQGIVSQSNNVEYSAGQFINLDAGFEVGADSNFLAKIEGCQ